MKKQVYRALYFALIAMLSVSYAVGQSNRDIAVAAAGDKYVISAKAGGVNYVEGAVGVVRKTGKSGYLLKRDQIEIGDRVSTGADGRAEILLNPGSYMRIGPNSAFEFVTTSLDDLQIKLDSGSTIFEVFASNEFKVAVVSPKGRLQLIESGVFRIDIMADGAAKIAVWEGKAQLGTSSGSILKKGREAVVKNGNATISKFDRDDKDGFELWSKMRGKELAKNVARLKNRDLRTSLMRSFVGRGWGMYNSLGLWVYDFSFGGFCFLPFGRGWYSPYGYGYGNSIWYYQLPPVIYYPPTTGGGSTGPTVTPIATQGDRRPVPPFVRMQGSPGGVTRTIQDTGGFPDRSGPVYSPSSTSNSPSSVPSSPPIVVNSPQSSRESRGKPDNN